MVAAHPYAEERAPRVLVSVAAVAVVAIDVLYLGIVRAQDGPSDSPLVAPFISGYLAVLAVALGASLVLPRAVRAALRGAAAAGLLVMAVLTALSIGVAVLAAAAIAVAAVVTSLSRARDRRMIIATIGGAVVGVAVLVIGLQVAWSYVSCPATGESGGTLPSFIGAGAAYQCSNGVLTVNR